MYVCLCHSTQVYIVGHMPPGSDERQIGIIPNGHTTFSEKNNFRYLRLVRRYSSIIQGQFFGHLHSDSFRIVYNDIGKIPTLLFTVIYSHLIFCQYAISNYPLSSHIPPSTSLLYFFLTYLAS